ncbi:hypothetical protein NXS19_003720 [Fusarium pseudograminearum]|nr:hypothetical protein NXS19_003720 [Fusarium pseudograminearum]
MRIAIREQLAALVLLAVLVSLAIVSIPTWIYVNRFVVDIERDGLQLTASLKASRISAELDLIETIAMTISSRILVQNALTNYYNTGRNEWEDAREDLESALSVSTASGLLQIRLFSRNNTKTKGGVLLNVTSLSVPEIKLPYKDSEGSNVRLGNSDLGYPQACSPTLHISISNDQTMYGTTQPHMQPRPSTMLELLAMGVYCSVLWFSTSLLLSCP